MKKILLILFIAVLSVQMGMAQEAELKDSPVDFTVSLQSNHLWRGLVITDKPMFSVQTIFTVNKSKSLTAGFWGGMAFSNESDGTYYKEINYYVQYAANGFSIGLWDLFNTRGVESPDVWDYNKETTGHLLDLRTSYNFGEKFPLTLEADVLLYGSGDSQYANGEFEQRYSTYIQVAYPLIQGAKVDLNTFVGAGFSFNGDTHLYGDGGENFDIVNVGLTASKVLKLSTLRIPVSATTMWNPSTKIARVQFTVKLF